MKAFISYSWDSAEHQDWVVNLANQLRRDGIDTDIDVFITQQETTNLNKMMVSKIQSSDFIIVVLTSKYKVKAESWKGGVGFETELILPLLQDDNNRNKLIFIIRDPGKRIDDLLPFHIKGYYAIDFSDEQAFSSKYRELLHRIYGVPIYEKVELGVRPVLLPKNHQQRALQKGNSNSNIVSLVSTVQGFYEAVSSNRTIVLQKGTYNLSEMAQLYHPFISWEEKFDGYSPTIIGVENLTIKSEDGVQILIDPKYAFVLAFRDCHDILIENTIMGHVEGGYCTGGVIRLENTHSVKINQCTLFGCGTKGLELINTTDVSITNSTIKECTYHLLTIDNCKRIDFINSTFRDTGEFDLINIKSSSEVRFLGCTIRNNFTVTDYFEHLFVIDDTSEIVSLLFCVISNNEVPVFCNNPSKILMEDTLLQSNLFN